MTDSHHGWISTAEVFIQRKTYEKHPAWRLFKDFVFVFVEKCFSLWLLCPFRHVSPETSHCIPSIIFDCNTWFNSNCHQVCHLENLWVFLVLLMFLFFNHASFYSLLPGAFPQHCFPRRSGRTASVWPSYYRCEITPMRFGINRVLNSVRRV